MLTYPDGMRYVGQAVDFDARMRNHGCGHGHSRKVQEWNGKYSWSSVIKEPLFECDDMNSAEIATIAERNTLWPNGLNLTKGGEAPDGEYVRESWRRPEVRERHIMGRKRAWADPTKRANIMAGRWASEKVRAAKLAKKQNGEEANAKRTATWEAKREARLEGLTGKEREKRIARMNGDGERARLKAAEKRRTSSRSHPLPQQREGISEGVGPSVQAGAAHSAASQHSPRSALGSTKEMAKLDPVVYKLTNKINGKGYVGKTKDSYQRMWQHRVGKKGKSGKLQYVDAAIQKYGWENFEVEMLETNVDSSRLLECEGSWMTQCDTLVPKGYNILKPGVEVISMSDPEIRARWEAANPAGVLKSVECKREKREKRLEEIGGEQAEELRYRLEKEAGRNRKRHNGEALPPDGRLLPSAKRQATWARKLEERLAKMSPEDAKKARAKHDSQKKYADANKEKVAAKNSAPKNQQYQKGYRAANKGKRLLLGRTAETSGWSAQRGGER